MIKANEARNFVKAHKENNKAINKMRAEAIADIISNEIRRSAENGYTAYKTEAIEENNEVLKMIENMIFFAGFMYKREENVFIIKW